MRSRRKPSAKGPTFLVHRKMFPPERIVRLLVKDRGIQASKQPWTRTVVNITNCDDYQLLSCPTGDAAARYTSTQ